MTDHETAIRSILNTAIAASNNEPYRYSNVNEQLEFFCLWCEANHNYVTNDLSTYIVNALSILQKTLPVVDSSSQTIEKLKLALEKFFSCLRKKKLSNSPTAANLLGELYEGKLKNYSSAAYFYWVSAKMVLEENCVENEWYNSLLSRIALCRTKLLLLEIKESGVLKQKLTHNFENVDDAKKFFDFVEYCGDVCAAYGTPDEKLNSKCFYKLLLESFNTVSIFADESSKRQAQNRLLAKSTNPDIVEKCTATLRMTEFHDGLSALRKKYSESNNLDLDTYRASNIELREFYNNLINTIIERIGPPPTPIAILSVGAFGRMEANLFSDFEFAIIWKNFDEDLQHDNIVNQQNTYITLLVQLIDFEMTLLKTHTQLLDHHPNTYCCKNSRRSDGTIIGCIDEFLNGITETESLAEYDFHGHLLPPLDGTNTADELALYHQFKKKLNEIIMNLFPSRLQFVRICAQSTLDRYQYLNANNNNNFVNLKIIHQLIIRYIYCITNTGAIAEYSCERKTNFEIIGNTLFNTEDCEVQRNAKLLKLFLENALWSTLQLQYRIAIMFQKDSEIIDILQLNQFNNNSFFAAEEGKIVFETATFLETRLRYFIGEKEFVHAYSLVYSELTYFSNYWFDLHCLHFKRYQQCNNERYLSEGNYFLELSTECSIIDTELAFEERFVSNYIITDPTTNISKFSSSQHKEAFIKAGKEKYGKRATFCIYNSLHIKLFPELPGIEYAASCLAHMTSGLTASFSVLKCFMGKSGATIPVLVSKTVIGDNLQDEIQLNCDILDEIEAENFGFNFIKAILTNPCDDRPVNFIVYKSKSPFVNKMSKKLICVDNDHSFIHLLEREFLETQLKLQSIIFCADRVRTERVHPNVIHKILSIEPEVLLSKWLLAIQVRDIDYCSVFGNNLHDNSSENGYTIPMVLHADTAVNVLYKLFSLRSVLSVNSEVTYFELLKFVQPIVARWYDIGFQQPSLKPYNRLEVICKKQSGVNFKSLNVDTQHWSSVIANVPSQKDIAERKKYTPKEMLERINFAIPQGCSTLIQKIRNDLLQKDDKSYFALPSDSLREEVINGKIASDGKIFPAFKFSLLSQSQQLFLLSTVLKMLPIGGIFDSLFGYFTSRPAAHQRFARLCLNGCTALDRDSLFKIGSKLNELMWLDIRNCPLLTKQDVIKFQNRFPNLKTFLHSYYAKGTTAAAADDDSYLLLFKILFETSEPIKLADIDKILSSLTKIADENFVVLQLSILPKAVKDLGYDKLLPRVVWRLWCTLRTLSAHANDRIRNNALTSICKIVIVASETLTDIQIKELEPDLIHAVRHDDNEIHCTGIYALILLWEKHKEKLSLCWECGHVLLYNRVVVDKVQFAGVMLGISCICRIGIDKSNLNTKDIDKIIYILSDPYDFYNHYDECFAVMIHLLSNYSCNDDALSKHRISQIIALLKVKLKMVKSLKEHMQILRLFTLIKERFTNFQDEDLLQSFQNMLDDEAIANSGDVMKKMLSAASVLHGLASIFETDPLNIIHTFEIVDDAPSLIAACKLLYLYLQQNNSITKEFCSKLFKSVIESCVKVGDESGIEFGFTILILTCTQYNFTICWEIVSPSIELIFNRVELFRTKFDVLLQLFVKITKHLDHVPNNISSLLYDNVKLFCERNWQNRSLDGDRQSALYILYVLADRKFIPNEHINEMIDFLKSAFQQDPFLSSAHNALITLGKLAENKLLPLCRAQDVRSFLLENQSSFIFIDMHDMEKEEIEPLINGTVLTSLEEMMKDDVYSASTASANAISDDDVADNNFTTPLRHSHRPLSFYENDKTYSNYTDLQMVSILQYLFEDDKLVKITLQNDWNNHQKIKEQIGSMLSTVYDGCIVVVPVHYSNDHWVGFVITFETSSNHILIVFSDPKGLNIQLPQNTEGYSFYKLLCETFSSTNNNGIVTLVDLGYNQQLGNAAFAGPIVIDTLHRIASYNNLSSLTTSEELLMKIRLRTCDNNDADMILNEHRDIERKVKSYTKEMKVKYQEQIDELKQSFATAKNDLVQLYSLLNQPNRNHQDRVHLVSLRTIDPNTIESEEHSIMALSPLQKTYIVNETTFHEIFLDNLSDLHTSQMQVQNMQELRDNMQTLQSDFVCLRETVNAITIAINSQPSVTQPGALLQSSTLQWIQDFEVQIAAEPYQNYFLQEFVRQFNAIFITSMVLETGLVSCEKKGIIGYSANIFQTIGNMIPMVGVGCNIMTMLLNAYDRKLQKQKVSHLFHLANSAEEMTLLAKYIALHILLPAHVMKQRRNHNTTPQTTTNTMPLCQFDWKLLDEESKFFELVQNITEECLLPTIEKVCRLITGDILMDDVISSMEDELKDAMIQQGVEYLSDMILNRTTKSATVITIPDEIIQQVAESHAKKLLTFLVAVIYLGDVPTDITMLEKGDRLIATIHDHFHPSMSTLLSVKDSPLPSHHWEEERYVYAILCIRDTVIDKLIEYDPLCLLAQNGCTRPVETTSSISHWMHISARNVLHTISSSVSSKTVTATNTSQPSPVTSAANAFSDKEYFSLLLQTILLRTEFHQGFVTQVLTTNSTIESHLPNIDTTKVDEVVAKIVQKLTEEFSETTKLMTKSANFPSTASQIPRLTINLYDKSFRKILYEWIKGAF